MVIVMISIITWNVAMMVETVVDATSTHNTALIANALILTEVGVEQLVLNQQLVAVQHLKQQDQQLHHHRHILQEQQLQLQLDATRDGLQIIIVMTSIIIWNVAMMVETVVDVTLLHPGVQNAYALIQMEAGMEQLALNQQLVQQLHQF